MNTLLTQIKTDAIEEAQHIELPWEKFDDPDYRKDFLLVMEKTINLIPELEHLFTKLTSNKSILYPGEDTPLSYPDIEQYTNLVHEELLQSYLLQELYTRYQLVENILTLEHPHDAE
jgi:hypothetical protein